VIRLSSRKVYEQKNLTDKLEEIVASFVTRELASEVGILKARTCWLLGRYGGLNFLNANNLNAIITVKNTNYSNVSLQLFSHHFRVYLNV